MAGYSHLHQRGGTYWFRRRVPTHLVEVLGKGEWKTSLRTKDREEAKRRLRERAIETDHEINVAEAQAARKVSPPVSEVEARAMAQEALARWLANDEDARRTFGPVAFRSAEVDLEDNAGDARVHLAHGEWQQEAGEAAAALRRSGRWYPEGDPSVRLVAHELLRARVQFTEAVERRQAGEVVETPPQGRPAVVAPQPHSATLGNLIDTYKADRERQYAGTTRKYAHVFRALEEALDRDTPIRSITRADCRGVRDLLAQMPVHMTKRYPKMSIRDAIAAAQRDRAPAISPGTLGTYLNNLSAVFKWAVAEEMLERNPAQGLGGRGEISVRRRGFTPDELERIFTVLSGEREERPWRFWVPAIALYSGARAGELAQLLASDVRMVEGVHCMDLSAFDEDGRRVAGKRLKTAASQRIVPIHPALIKAGFLRFVRDRGGEGRLFPELRAGPNDSLTHEFSKWWGRFLDGVGLTEPALTFHSFRHGFRDAARRAEISFEMADALGGWRTPGVGTGYGKREQVALLNRELCKISYGRFALPRVSVGGSASATSEALRPFRRRPVGEPTE